MNIVKDLLPPGRLEEMTTDYKFPRCFYCTAWSQEAALAKFRKPRNLGHPAFAL